MRTSTEFRKIVFLLLALFGFFNYAPLASAGDLNKNVLIINSYSQNHDWSAQECEGLQKAFSADQGVSLCIEYMDWKQYPTEQNLEYLYNYYKYKYAAKKIDMVITTDDAALLFALKHRQELFSDAPIVFGGVYKETSDVLLAGVSNVTGIYEQADPEGTIAAAKKMVPEIKDIYIVHDKTETGVIFGNLIKAACAAIDSSIVLHDLSDYSFEEICKIASKLDNHSIILMDAYNLDASGPSLSITDFASRLCKTSAVPVFTTAESILGQGPIGGSLLSPSLHGQMLGNLAKKILAGQDINATPIVDEKSVYYSFDNSVLTKFAIPPERLPENTIIINKPFSTYETYKTQIHIIGAVFLLLMTLILYLFHTIRLRKKVEANLITNNEQLSALYKEMSASKKILRQNFDELTAQKQKINKLAYYDTITGLPNRAAFQEKVNELIKTRQDTALFFIDLDNFKMVNDSFGHSTGDKLLAAVAGRLCEIIEKEAIAFRLGGDEFIIICPYYNEQEKSEQFAQNMIRTLSKPYYIENNYFHINASVGIVFSPDIPSSCDDLLKSADMALYHSKEAGKGTYTFYNNAMGEAVLKKISIQNDLHKAIETNEFMLYYQPIIDLQTGHLSGLEALIRWQHPVKGLIAPDKFIGIAEESGKMIEIGTWVIKNACHFLRELYELGYRDFHISVNVSAIQLLQNNFAALVCDVLTTENLPPDYLMLEITESVLIESFDQIISTLLEIRQTGVKIALDDFGCGYSSLTYLRQLPIDVLKIDKTFVSDILQVNSKDRIIGSIIMLAKQMGLRVIAEGVERPEQITYLKQYSCDAIQGYLISKPVSKEDITKFWAHNIFPTTSTPWLPVETKTS
ncbi:hypothetical protein SRRS_48500 [Sporomusa rhizae]|uniref:ABC transporter substrate binding protein n=1 Tax=Sporomusa rhizae TaxID=357999 RepID=UPI00352B50BD